MAANALTRLSQRTPLRGKLITALLALLALALAIISFTSTAVFQGYLQHQADGTLSNLVGGIHQHGLSEGVQNYFASNGYAVEVLDANGNEVPQFSDFDQLGPPPPQVPTSSAWLNAHQGKAVTVPAAAGGENWRVISYPVQYPNPDGSGYQTWTLIVGDNLGTISQTVSYLVKVDVVVSVIILLGLAVVSVAVVRTNLRPLDDIEETAQDIAAGHLDRRVPDRDPRTEVGRLGQSINTMLTQIENAFHAQQQSEEAAVQSEERMRRCIADARHQLRTPLTAIRGFAEYYRQRGGAEGSGGSLPGEDLNRIMQRVEAEASRMGVLVEDLLQLARLDQQRPIEHRPVDLLVLAADAVQDSRMIAPGRTLKLDVEPGPAVLGH